VTKEGLAKLRANDSHHRKNRLGVWS